uniref:uncharacterized protein LOC120348638 n=1 Tax=Styela clava TaxID=7725 RepID=UPI00193A0C2F|nr:uncharacterized protein LOC120348638 [Styela clava]
MKTSIVFILIYVIVSSWCQDETVFHCSPKPGCQIAQCDPVAVGWDRPGFNIDEHLHDKEFSITCKSKSRVQPQNAVNLFPFVSRNTMDIGSIKSELEELEGNSNKNTKNIEALEQKYSGIRETQNVNAEHSAEIADLKQSREELRKDLIRLETMNNKLLKELEEQKQGNSEMKKAMERIEQKLSTMEKPQQVRSRNQQRPTTTTKTTLKPTHSPENCELKIGNICYFFVKQTVVYDTAVDICRKRKAVVGLIRNEESYNAIKNFLIKGMSKSYTWIRMWTGIQFDPKTRDVTPADSFVKWDQGIPNTGIDFKDHTNVYLFAGPNPLLQGMMNASPTWDLNGVICEILI